MVICPSLADAFYSNCFNTCMDNETEPCSERVNSAISYLQSQINSLTSTRDRYQEILDDINSALSECMSNAAATCTSSCEDAEDPDACYDQCYEIENNNCIASACNGSAASSCNNQCSNLPDPKICDTQCEDEDPQNKESCMVNCRNLLDPVVCYNQCYTAGTSNCEEHRANLSTEIENINAQITVLQQNLQQLPDCCNSGDVAQQNACIEGNLI
jgi:outer membrane murein-binding lipoprotein Lpp